jgi:hypothetical protein
LETGQLRYAAALVLVVLLGAGGCARARSTPAATLVELAQSCQTGPHCVTGQVQDRYGSPIPDVRCSVRTDEGEVIEVKSDDRGVFLIDRLASPPHGATFVKDGYASEVMVLQPVATGAAARIYVTLQQADEDSCTCEPAAIFAGQPPCPEEKCAGDRTREAPPPANEDR